jgi:hypothetical protein
MERTWNVEQFRDASGAKVANIELFDRTQFQERLSFAGFGIAERTNPMKGMTFHRTTVFVPLWMVESILAIPVVVTIANWFRKRRQNASAGFQVVGATEEAAPAQPSDPTA